MKKFQFSELFRVLYCHVFLSWELNVIFSCWTSFLPGAAGNNDRCQLGDNTTTNKTIFIRMIPSWGPAVNATAIGAGSNQAVVLAGILSSQGQSVRPFFLPSSTPTWGQCTQALSWRWCCDGPGDDVPKSGALFDIWHQGITAILMEGFMEPLRCIKRTVLCTVIYIFFFAKVVAFEYQKCI